MIKPNHGESILLAQFELLYQLREGCQLLLLDQLELIDEEDEVFEAGIQMILQSETENHLEVRVVDMSVDSKQSLENGLDHGEEVFGEGNS